MFRRNKRGGPSRQTGAATADRGGPRSAKPSPSEVSGGLTAREKSVNAQFEEDLAKAVSQSTLEASRARGPQRTSDSDAQFERDLAAAIRESSINGIYSSVSHSAQVPSAPELEQDLPTNGGQSKSGTPLGADVHPSAPALDDEDVWRVGDSPNYNPDSNFHPTIPSPSLSERASQLEQEKRDRALAICIAEVPPTTAGTIADDATEKVFSGIRGNMNEAYKTGPERLCQKWLAQDFDLYLPSKANRALVPGIHLLQLHISSLLKDKLSKLRLREAGLVRVPTIPELTFHQHGPLVPESMCRILQAVGAGQYTVVNHRCRREADVRKIFQWVLCIFTGSPRRPFPMIMFTAGRYFAIVGIEQYTDSSLVLLGLQGTLAEMRPLFRENGEVTFRMNSSSSFFEFTPQSTVKVLRRDSRTSA